MSHRTLAVAALVAALLLPAVVPGVADAAPTATAGTHTPAKPALTAAERARLHRLHLAHLHRLHILHLRTLANLARARAAGSQRARVVKAAERYIGQWYSYGNLDCSGLTQRAYAAVGKHLPRTAWGQAHAGRAVTRARPGDILVYPGASHVALVTRVNSVGRVLMTEVARHTGTVVGFQVPYVSNYGVRSYLT